MPKISFRTRSYLHMLKGSPPAKCVDVNGTLLFDEEGEYLLVNRLINTKALLECSSNGEAMRLLGKA